MRLSAYPIQSLKEVPADAEVVSHRLMLRAGLIRRVAGGLYTWLPMGLRVLRKVERVIREEMNRAGALEISMPVAQPADLWVESGRWDKFGPELLRFKDRHDRDMVLGPTHEEVVTDLARRELRSYRQLPVNFYQIQTKFRDEIRPRFGVMRAREFVMKDAYSFHADEASLAEGYRKMYEAYSAIFTRLGLRFRAVHADTGAIGGSASQEFHVLADSGEDAIVFSDGDDYAANLELAEALPPRDPRPAAKEESAKLQRPRCEPSRTCPRCSSSPRRGCSRRSWSKAADGGLVALVVRGDHELNALKAQRLAAVAKPLRMADAGRIAAATGCEPGSLGPVGPESRSSPITRPPPWRISSAARTRPIPPDGRQLGARLAGTRRRRPPQRRRRGSQPRRARPAGDRPRHRGRPHLPARPQVQRGMGATVQDEQGRDVAHAHGLLRHRRQAHRGRGHRAEPRQARHHLAGAARAFRRRVVGLNWEKSEGVPRPPPPCTAASCRRRRGAPRRPRRAARRQVRRRRFIGIPHVSSCRIAASRPGGLEYRHRRAAERGITRGEGGLFLRSRPAAWRGDSARGRSAPRGCEHALARSPARGRARRSAARPGPREVIGRPSSHARPRGQERRRQWDAPTQPRAQDAAAPGARGPQARRRPEQDLLGADPARCALRMEQARHAPRPVASSSWLYERR